MGDSVIFIVCQFVGAVVLCAIAAGVLLLVCR
jgi:hypothetical protein